MIWGGRTSTRWAGESFQHDNQVSETQSNTSKNSVSTLKRFTRCSDSFGWKSGQFGAVTCMYFAGSSFYEENVRDKARYLPAVLTLCHHFK